jgi:predicted SAM-dependent methyltransferase
MLATLEHMSGIEEIALECARILRPSGHIVLTVPDPLVDKLLDILIRFRVLEGMSSHQHHRLNPESLPRIFDRASCSVRVWKKFQLGLNNLIIFERQ